MDYILYLGENTDADLNIGGRKPYFIWTIFFT